MDLYFAEGPETVWRRHELTARACRAGVKALGLSLWAAREEIASPTTTAVRVPAGLRDDDILAAARSGFGVVVSAGRGETKGKPLRIWPLGAGAGPIYAVVGVTALGGALRRLGFTCDVGAGVEAAMSVIAAAQN